MNYEENAETADALVAQLGVEEFDSETLGSNETTSLEQWRSLKAFVFGQQRHRPQPSSERMNEISHAVEAGDSQRIHELMKEDAAHFEMPTDIAASAQAVERLDAMGPEAVPALIRGLGSTSRSVRNNCALLLAEHGDERAVEPLIDVLRRDKDQMVRLMAAQALGKIGDKRALDALVNALEETPPDNSDTLREAAQGSLRAKLRVMKMAFDSSFIGIGSGAAEALGMLKDPRAVEPLIAALKSGDLMTREAATTALGEIGDRRAISPLRALLQETEQPRPEDAASAFFAANSIPDLRDYQREQVRDAAQAALEKLEGEPDA